MGHKLGRGVKGLVLKYHTDPTIRLGIICEKQCNTASETHSSFKTVGSALPWNAWKALPLYIGGNSLHFEWLDGINN